MLVYGRGLEIVGGEMVAAVGDESVEIPLFPGHPMQRLDVGADRHDRHQLRFGVDQQLSPGPLYWKRLDLVPVSGEPAFFDQTSPGEQLDRAPIRGAVQWHRQVEIARVNSQRGTGDGDAFRVPRQLELRGCGTE